MNMNIVNRVVLPIGMLGCLLLPLASTADAAVKVTEPATMCVEDNTGSLSIRHTFGNAFNASASAKIFNCPMTVTNPTAVNFVGTVTVNDQTTTDGVACALRACNSTGTSCSVSPTFSTVTQLGAAFTGIVGSGNLTSSGSAGGYSYMRCTVAGVGAGQSAVVSLSWLE